MRESPLGGASVGSLGSKDDILGVFVEGGWREGEDGKGFCISHVVKIHSRVRPALSYARDPTALFL